MGGSLGGRSRGKRGGHEREPGEGPKGEERGERARGKKEGPQYEKRS